MKHRPFRERFDSKWVLNESTGCWEWTDYLSDQGYGKIKPTGSRVGIPAHPAAYEIHVGPIPEGLVIDHLCRNRSCVNPDHLEPVRSKENVLRGIAPPALNKRMTHCKRGHEFTIENTYVYKHGNKTSRLCKTCRNAANRVWVKKNRTITEKAAA